MKVCDVGKGKGYCISAYNLSSTNEDNETIYAIFPKRYKFDSFLLK
jgi:hypothetical protein